MGEEGEREERKRIGRRTPEWICDDDDALS
jgi:hypothetical protein